MRQPRPALAPPLRWLLLALSTGLAACTLEGSATTQEVGARIYNGNCTACHQQNGQGIPTVYPSLVGSRVVLGDPNAFVRWVVKGQRPASMPAGRYATAMPQYGWMSAGDAAALLSYVRASFGNAAPPVEAALVAAALDD